VDLFSNPMMLIVLAIGALLLFGGGNGGSLNLTELILSLLRSLKLIPQPQAAASEQVFQGFMRRAWERLRAGDIAQARSLMDEALQQSETYLSQEQAIVPAGLSTILSQWMKSPIFLIAIAVGAFLIFGGGSCKKPAPQPQGMSDVSDVSDRSDRSDRSDSSPRVTLCSYDLRPARLTEPVYRVPTEPADLPPALPADWQHVACPLDGPPAAAEVGWWTDGPVRRVASAPVRVIVRARPLRRLARVFCFRRR